MAKSLNPAAYTDLFPTESFNDLVARYQEANAVKKTADPFVLGDICVTISARRQVQMFLDDTDTPLKTFQNNRWISVTYPDAELRGLGLTYTHYREASSADEPEALLRRAAAEKWPTRRIKEEIQGTVAKTAAIPDDDEDEFVYCARCSGPMFPPRNIQLTGCGEPVAFDRLDCLKAYVAALV